MFPRRAEHIPAFAMTEAVVAMFVMAVVMGVVFVIYGNLSDRLLDLRAQNRINQDLARFSYVMNKDMFECSRTKSDSFSLHFDKAFLPRSSYLFLADRIIRQQGKFQDTFQIAVRGLKQDSVTDASGKVMLERITVQAYLSDTLCHLKFFRRRYPQERLCPKILTAHEFENTAP